MIIIITYLILFLRIIGALSCMSTLFIGVILMARINSDAWQVNYCVSVSEMKNGVPDEFKYIS